MPRLDTQAVYAALDHDAHDQDGEDEAFDADPWHFLRGRWSAGAGGLDHDNFTCDMALRANGDFLDAAQRLATLAWIAQRLNGEAVPDESWARGAWHAEPAEHSLFHSNPERDVGLRLSGDFASPRRKAQALDGLARLLNGGTLPTTGGRR